MLAVCDLITQVDPHLDAADVIRTAAIQLARLTRSDLGVVAAEVDGEFLLGSYPRPVDTEMAAQLMRAASEATPEISSTICSAVIGSPPSGFVRASGPIDGTFSALDEWLVAVVAAQVESQLHIVGMHKERMQAAELVRDAVLAGELQQALLPTAGIDTPGIDVAARLRPARHVGGDMFDIFPSANEAIAVVADVAGKGSPAALLTATVHAAAQRAAITEGPNPGAIVSAVDDDLRRLLERSDRLVTLAVASIDPRQGVIRLASAGHSPIILRSGRRAVLVEPGSPPLGAGDFARHEISLEVAPGDVFVMASDGTIDQSNAAGKQFGLSRLLDTISNATADSAQSILDRVFAALDEFATRLGQDDDQALVVCRIVGHH